MSQFFKLGLCMLLTASAVWAIGCSSKVSDKPAGKSTAGEKVEDPAMTANIAAAIAELPAEDRPLAEKQKVCPVSGEPLGSMGAPLKFNIKGNDVFICCEGCKDKLHEDQDTYLAKLGLSAK